MTKDNKAPKQEYVYCVINTEAQARVSQWYSRAGDAKRKSKGLNGRTPWTKAVGYTLSDMQVLECEGE